ncbi:MAG TPA: hypothetical protein VKS24_01925 [Bradyrhizobium sp.]|nr:hypothetical protein [Bradyrhizobium sp.]
MTKLALFAAAVVVLCSTLAGPAVAGPKAALPYNAYTEGDWCSNREPGNPYTKEEDYIAWSAWRARGGWDDHNDFNCRPGLANRGAGY